MSLLVANGQLEIKVAITKTGMYHDKVGLFADSEGNEIIFQGSANETEAGLSKDGHKEGISVWASWIDYGASTHREEHKQSLTNMWEKEVLDDMVVMDFGKAPIEKMLARARELNQDFYTVKFEKALESIRSFPSPPSTIGKAPYKLKEHQRIAQKKWQENEFRGILKLATGAGKTITAIDAITKIYSQTLQMMVS